MIRPDSCPRRAANGADQVVLAGEPRELRRGVLGEFKWSSQHLDQEVCGWGVEAGLLSGFRETYPMFRAQQARRSVVREATDYAGDYLTLQMVPSIEHRGRGRLIPALSAGAARGRLAAAAQQYRVLTHSGELPQRKIGGAAS